MVARENHLIGPTMEQPQYNLFCRDLVERDFHRVYSAVGLGTTIWSPLASGILSGKYSQGIPKNSRATLPGFEWLRERFESEEGLQNISKAKQLEGIARELGISLARLSIAWCLKNPNVTTAILGASREEQLQENLKALGDVSLLNDSVIQQIEAIIQNKPKLPQNYLA